MSTYDDLVAGTIKKRRAQAYGGAGHYDKLGLLELADIQRIAAAIDRARVLEGQPLEDHHMLTDYLGQTAPLKTGGAKIGDHGLVLRGGDRCYLAHMLVPGRALPLLVARRSLWRDASTERTDAEHFGPEVAVDVKPFARRFVVRCRSEAQAALFLTSDLVGNLANRRLDLRRITLEPGHGGIEIDVLAEVGDVSNAPPAITLARSVHAATFTLANTGGGFVAASQPAVESEGRLASLLDDVRAATALLAGHVERVGAAAEARMELDAPAGLTGALRVSIAAARSLALSFTGELSPAFTSRATMRPERTRLERARGLFDKKLGDPELDAAFLIDGNREAALLLATDSNAALALVARSAELMLDGNGVHVTLDDLPDDPAALTDGVCAALALWRAAARARAGVTDADETLD